MKRFLLLCLSVLLGAMPVAAQRYGRYARAIQVQVNGRPVAFDQPPITMGGRVLVPLRGVFQQMGASVVFNPATRGVSAQRGQTQIGLAIGSPTAYINGRAMHLDQAPILVGGRALVPLRFLSEALGARVRWMPNRNLVAVDSLGAAAPPPVPPPPPYGEAPDNEVIHEVEVSTRGPLMPGQDLQVTMLAVPGGIATFDIGHTHNQPMLENPPGTYNATYTVRVSDRNPAARVRCHLRLPDGRRFARDARQRVALGTTGPAYPPPYGDQRQPERRRLITSVVTNATGPLYPGQPVEVTLVGQPGGLATFDMGYQRNVPMREVAPGTYVGTATVPQGQVGQDVPVEGHLRMADGRTDSRRAGTVQEEP